MWRMILVALTVVFLTELGFAQNKRRIRRDDLGVESRVSVVGLADGCLRFQYVFHNSDTSRQKLVGVTIELNDDWIEYGGSLRNVMPPKEKDWGEFPTIVETMGWVTAYDTTGKDILEAPPMSAVLPGESIGFSFEAKGLPGIGVFWAEGWAPWYFTAGEKDSLIREGYDWEKSRALDENFFKGLTIVRRSPPEPLRAVSFLDTLLFYTWQSAQLGWLAKERDRAQELPGARRPEFDTKPPREGGVRPGQIVV